MIRILVKWATLALAIWIIATYTPALRIAEPKVAIYAALALGLINVLIKPIVKLLSFPINVLTLGLFTFIVNGAMLMIVPYFVSGLALRSFWWDVAAAAMISIITAVLNAIILGHED